METRGKNITCLDPDTQQIGDTPVKNKNNSETLFDSPVYEPDDDVLQIQSKIQVPPPAMANVTSTSRGRVSSPLTKRKIADGPVDSTPKIKKLDINDDDFTVSSSQALDEEVIEIIEKGRNPVKSPTLVTSRARTPKTLPSSRARNTATPSSSLARAPRSLPRKPKRSNSAEIKKKTPKTEPRRSASADTTKRYFTRSVLLDKINIKMKDDLIIISDSSGKSETCSSLDFFKEIHKFVKSPETILEESGSELDDSQNFRLVLSPSPDEEKETSQNRTDKYNSDPVTVKDRREVINPGKVSHSRSEGYNYSDQSNNLSQPKNFKGRTTDQDSTDSMTISIDDIESPNAPSLASRLLPEKRINSEKDKDAASNGCINVDSPDLMPSLASKLVSKLSNGNSSTPTETVDSNGNGTPDMIKLNSDKEKRKNESFRASNTTTPSTISPLQNGHSIPINTPQLPVFEVHVTHSEDCEFLSLVVVRTDSDLGVDACREYQRVSKRFTVDPYMADVSSVSPGSATSGGPLQLPNRTSFVSTVSSNSTSSSNRTSDGNFVVPHPPRISFTKPPASVKGYEALMKKLQEIFSHIRDASIDDHNKSSNEEKCSVGIQTSLSDGSLSNGNASPAEVNKCDKVTPKSSLKKTRVPTRIGRRPMVGKTKRAILPTQPEEPEYLQELISPEMVPTNGESEKSPTSEKDDKPVVETPKSITNVKQKNTPILTRPETPVQRSNRFDSSKYPPDTVVLARWVDRRYYSGKITKYVDINKYLVTYDDGRTKTLIDDFIVFGDMKRLPLQGQSVYAMVDKYEHYEPGLVLEVKEDSNGAVTYRCTTDWDTMVIVTANEIYLTEDQARSIRESATVFPTTPTTPRQRGLGELDLDNIIQGPRSARTRDKVNSSALKRVISPKSPKASTSGLKPKNTPGVSPNRRRFASESSEVSESSNSAPPVRTLEEVAGVEPEVQRTPRKIDGIKAGPLQLKGASKQKIGKKNSKLTKFENDEDTVSQLGPIPTDVKLFVGLHFLLTCTEPPRRTHAEKFQATRHYSSEEDGENTSGLPGTDTEDLEFSNRPFNKERLKEQLEAGGGKVYSHFDDVPKNKYSVCKLIAPRPCLTAKFIQCVAANIRPVSHAWVIESCAAKKVLDIDSYALPAGWSIQRQAFVNWLITGKRNTSFYKDKLILLCGDQDFVKFWERVCTLAGANTRVVNEGDLNMTRSPVALVTEWDCAHEVQNKANQYNIPLVSTTWVVQCIIEARYIPPTSHDKFSFMYAEPE